MSLTFDWRGFAKFWMIEMDCTPVPLKKNGKEPWDGWEKLKGKTVTDEDIDRWVKNEDFGGLAGLFEWIKVPMILMTYNDLSKLDLFMVTFASVSSDDLKTYRDLFFQKFFELYEEHEKNKK